jgi:hypothetical protein
VGTSHLEGLALHAGDRVRFRRSAGQHWQEAVVEGWERDGSVALRDTNGASRAIMPELIEVHVTTRGRGRGRWIPATDRRWEQLALFGGQVGAPSRPTRRPARVSK